MNILVTGVCGFIGRHLVSVLQHGEWVITGVDKCTPHNEGDKKGDRHLNFKICDLSDPAAASEICKDMDIVLHLAGEADVSSSKEKHQLNNYVGSKNLLDSAKRNRVKQVIFLSTTKTTGNGDYGQTKAAVEKLLIAECQRGSMRYTIIKSPIVYGFGMKSGIVGWLSQYRKAVIPNVSRSQAELEMIGIDDLCRALELCIDNESVFNKVYKVSDGQCYKIRDIDKVARKLFGNKRTYLAIPEILVYWLAKIGDVLRISGVVFPLNSTRYKMLFANSATLDSKFTEATGFRPKANFLDEIPQIFGL